MFKENITKISLNERAVPPALLFVTFVSFGLLIPWLGFYWDDWPVIYLTQTQGINGFWGFYQYDRPFSAWTYILFTPILGVNPLGWHIFVLCLRWLSAVFLWMCLRTIWQKKADQVFWIALLFAVSPIFFQQQVAVAYSQHWICYLLYFISIYCMLKAQEDARCFYLYTLLSFSLALVHLFTLEYFVGLELLRLVVLWVYFRERDSQSSAKDILWLTTKTYSIYFAVLFIYLAWRLFFLDLPGGETNDPVLLVQFVQAPIQTMIGLIERALQDVFYLLTSWIVYVNPLDIDLDRPFSLAVLAVIIFTAFVSGFILTRYQPVANDSEDDFWSLRIILLGILVVLLGLLPVWMIGRQVTLGGDRFSFAAMFGICMILVGILDWLSSRRGAKITVVAVLLAMAIHTNLYIAKAYQRSWEKQRDFYWQLYWRAPHIQPGTPVISDGEIFSFVGLYSTSVGISLLYPPVDPPQNVPYWFFNYYEGINNILGEVVDGTTLDYSLRNYSFYGDSRNSLLIRFAPEDNKCLQIFSANDKDIKEIPVPFQKILTISNLDRISQEPIDPDWAPPRNIFGAEPDHPWCFYYQKADLARQNENWERVVRLLEEAQTQGFSPGDEREYLLFIDAYIKLGRFDEAYDLTMRVKSISRRNNDSLCALWAGNSGLQQASGYDSFYDQAQLELSCVN